MDSSGRAVMDARHRGSDVVSILLYQWIPLEALRCRQSLCRWVVSILLYQWIPLEAFLQETIWFFSVCFNPSVSMDSSGRNVRQLLMRFLNSRFNPSVSMDSSGRRLFGVLHLFPTQVSILLYQWIPLEDSPRHLHTYTRIKFQSFCINGFLWKHGINKVHSRVAQFQSFCINGFLWKSCHGCSTPGIRCSFNPSVSMDSSGSPPVPAIPVPLGSFNPSVSMDSSGSLFAGNDLVFLSMFQSFCINGFLWKKCEAIINAVSELSFQSFCINGFLWKTSFWRPPPLPDSSFNPSVSMDSSGRFAPPFAYLHPNKVSILLYQWIPLEAWYQQSAFPCSTVSILLYQWIPLEASCPGRP